MLTQNIDRRDVTPSYHGYFRVARKMYNVTEIFKVSQPEELHSIITNITVQKFKEGSMLFMPGDLSSEQIYILKQGQVDLYRLTSHGKRLFNGHVLPGTVFGLRGVLGRQLQRNFAEAVVDSVVYIINRDQFISYLKKQPDIAINLLEIAYFGICAFEDRLIESSYSPSYVKLACFILSNAESSSGLLDNFTHEQIGNAIGSVRQTVTEGLSLMRKRGLISTKPGRIWINDWQGLEYIVKEWES